MRSRFRCRSTPVTRLTKDIDLFTEIDDHEAIQIVEALRHALQGQGLLLVALNGHRMTALRRSRPDNQRRMHNECLLRLAEAKDSGFTHESFIDALRAIARLGDADWAEDGISNDDVQRLHTTFDAWRNRLGKFNTT
ncbi:MAG: hypothetical protein ACRDR6_26450 [Pseudonocardiaceae bacterium]